MKINHLKETMTEAGAGTSNVRELDPEELKQLQLALTDMMMDVMRVCKKHDLTLMLAGGSALGSVRHQGFIPWDDDLDLMMTRSDYVKLCDVFDRELGEKYMLVAPNHGELYLTRFPKIMKRDTILRSVTDVGAPPPCGIFLDIFLLDSIPENQLVRKIKGMWCNALMFIGSRVYLYERNNLVFQEHMSATPEARRALRVTLAIGKLFSFIPSRKWSDWADKAVRCRKRTGLLGLPTGRKHYSGEIFPENVFFPPSQGVFEGHEVPLPADCDAYLKNLYGDYMQIPPPEKREKHFIVELKL